MDSENSYRSHGGEGQQQQQRYSRSELLSDAKIVADAARSGFKSNDMDRAKVADAAGDLLDAAGNYGKFDETKGLGKYVDKAADYLHQFETTATAHGSNTVHPGGHGHSVGGYGGDVISSGHGHSGGHGHSCVAGGYGGDVHYGINDSYEGGYGSGRFGVGYGNNEHRSKSGYGNSGGGDGRLSGGYGDDRIDNGYYGDNERSKSGHGHSSGGYGGDDHSGSMYGGGDGHHSGDGYGDHGSRSGGGYGNELSGGGYGNERSNSVLGMSVMIVSKEIEDMVVMVVLVVRIMAVMAVQVGDMVKEIKQRLLKSSSRGSIFQPIYINHVRD